MDEDIPVVVIGGGQAGLSTSWLLVRAGVDHVVLERETVAHEWADRRWDSFCLVTPNRQCRLPGWSYDGPDPDGFMLKDEIVDFLRRYRKSFDPPVREGVEVTGLSAENGRYLVTTATGTIRCDSVVIATGGYHIPKIPRLAERLPERVTQLHSAQYQRPSDVGDGATLIIGTGQSGVQLAEDLHLAGRRVHLATGSTPRVARSYRGRDVMTWLCDTGHYDMPVEQHQLGTAVRAQANHYVTGRDGGHDIDLRAWALEGMQLYGHLDSVDGERLRFRPDLSANLDSADRVAEGIKDVIDAYIEKHGLDAPTEARPAPVWTPEAEPTELDLEAAGIDTVIWACGYAADYRWVDVPIFTGRGYPQHVRGVTSAPGLYVLGLPWLYTWGSGRFLGIRRDAEYVAGRVVDHVRQREIAPV